MSLQYLYRIPHNTISTIVPKVCSAIYKVLKDEFLLVSIINITRDQIQTQIIILEYIIIYSHNYWFSNKFY